MWGCYTIAGQGTRTCASPGEFHTLGRTRCPREMATGDFSAPEISVAGCPGRSSAERSDKMRVHWTHKKLGEW